VASEAKVDAVVDDTRCMRREGESIPETAVLPASSAITGLRPPVTQSANVRNDARSNDDDGRMGWHSWVVQHCIVAKHRVGTVAAKDKDNTRHTS
jgi:hypothetical protein